MNASVFSKDHPFLASIQQRYRLSGPHSLKNTQHIVLDITGSDFAYEPGDSIGVFPMNDPDLVKQILLKLNANGQESILHPKLQTHICLKDLLTKHVCLHHVSLQLLECVACSQPRLSLDKLDEVLNHAEARQAYTRQHDVLDTLDLFSPQALCIQSFMQTLRRLMPRLYSIASSPRQYPHEVHLTIAVTHTQHLGRIRKGAATHYLSDWAPIHQPVVPIFLAPSSFRLPADSRTDIIMIGPGTGIAPFRAFMQERDALQAKGRNWLFFGEQHQAEDFLYAQEWANMKEKQVLTHLSLAFSRDQKEKIYVQHRLMESAKLVWDWIEKGAYVYICGDAQQMAKSVEQTLQLIACQEGGLTEAQAVAYWKNMKKIKRYQKDVY